MKTLKYETVQDAMNSKEGQKLFKLLTDNMFHALENDQTLKNSIDRKPTFLGSEAYFKCLVFNILNDLSEA